MNDLRIGDKIRVIRNQAGHNYKTGTILTVRSIPLHHDDELYEIAVKEGGSYLYNVDVEKVYPPSNKPGKFIITDPIYIMNDKFYTEILDNHEKYGDPDFQDLKFPIKTIHRHTKEPITIHLIERTPYGGGGEYIHGIEPVASDSGLLCIAENEKEWPQESYGAKFEKLQDSMDMFQHILNKF